MKQILSNTTINAKLEPHFPIPVRTINIIPAGKELAQGPYVMARAGVEPTTLLSNKLCYLPHRTHDPPIE